MIWVCWCGEKGAKKKEKRMILNCGFLQVGAVKMFTVMVANCYGGCGGEEKLRKKNGRKE